MSPAGSPGARGPIRRQDRPGPCGAGISRVTSRPRSFARQVALRLEKRTRFPIHRASATRHNQSARPPAVPNLCHTVTTEPVRQNEKRPARRRHEDRTAPNRPGVGP